MSPLARELTDCISGWSPAVADAESICSSCDWLAALAGRASFARVVVAVDTGIVVDDDFFVYLMISLLHMRCRCMEATHSGLKVGCAGALR